MGEDIGIKLTPVVVRCLSDLLCNFGLIKAGLIETPNSTNRRYNPPWAVHPPPQPTPPSPTTYYFICTTCDTTITVKKVAQIQQCQ